MVLDMPPLQISILSGIFWSLLWITHLGTSTVTGENGTRVDNNQILRNVSGMNDSVINCTSVRDVLQAVNENRTLREWCSSEKDDRSQGLKFGFTWDILRWGAVALVLGLATGACRYYRYRQFQNRRNNPQGAAAASTVAAQSSSISTNGTGQQSSWVQSAVRLPPTDLQNASYPRQSTLPPSYSDATAYPSSQPEQPQSNFTSIYWDLNKERKF